MSGNSSLELHSVDLANFGRSQTISLVSRPKFVKNHESQTENTSVVVALPRIYESIIFRHCEANHRFAEAIQKIEQPNLARFVVQKIGIKDAVVPSADFLLESEKRGTPPKSEKRQLLARRGSGAGGAALLREKTSESKKQNSDSVANNAKTSIL